MLTKYYSGNQIKDEMCGAHGTKGEDERLTYGFGRETLRK
jgi:hypothetical protein